MAKYELDIRRERKDTCISSDRAEVNGRDRERYLERGERLMPERKLSENLHVARNTVKQAYEELCREGYASTKKGSGTYVDTSRRADMDEKVCGVIDDAIEKLASMGKSQKEIERIVHGKRLEACPGQREV